MAHGGLLEGTVRLRPKPGMEAALECLTGAIIEAWTLDTQLVAW
jgi:hypothetical protein